MAALVGFGVDDADPTALTCEAPKLFVTANMVSKRLKE